MAKGYLLKNDNGTVTFADGINPSDGATVGQLGGAPISITYAAALALSGAGTVADGQLYLITDRADTGILLVGQPDGESYSLAGSGGFLNADFQDAGDYSGVAAYSGIAAGTRRGVWNTNDEAGVPYVDGDIVIWNCLHYQVADDTAFDGNDPSTNVAAYQVLPKFIQTITYNNLVGVFSVGETITADNGATGIILTDDGIGVMDVFLTSGYSNLYLTSSISLTGNTSGATADVVSITQPVVENNMGYIEEWDEVEFSFVTDRINQRSDKLGNVVSYTSISTFQFGKTSVNFNLARGGSSITCLNQTGTVSSNTVLGGIALQVDLNSGIVSSNFIDSGGNLNCSNNAGQVINCTVKGNANITAAMNNAVVLSNCLFGNIVSVIDTTVSVDAKVCIGTGVGEENSGFSNFECTISITGLTTLNITTGNNYCGIVNLTSANATETIDTITNFPKDFPYTLYPEDGLILTLTGTAVVAAAAGDIVLAAASFVANGSNGDWVKLEGDRFNAPSIYSQLAEGQNYI